MPWLPASATGQGGLLAWGRPPELQAPNISGLVEAIWRMRQQQQQQLGQLPGQLAQTIYQQQKQSHLDDVANAMMYAQENNMQLGDVLSDPSKVADVPDYGGQSALAMKINEMRYDPYRQLTSKGIYYDPETGTMMRAGTQASMQRVQQQAQQWAQGEARRTAATNSLLAQRDQAEKEKAANAYGLTTGDFDKPTFGLMAANAGDQGSFTIGNRSYRYAQPGDEQTNPDYVMFGPLSTDPKLQNPVLPSAVASNLRDRINTPPMQITPPQAPSFQGTGAGGGGGLQTQRYPDGTTADVNGVPSVMVNGQWQPKQ